MAPAAEGRAAAARRPAAGAAARLAARGAALGAAAAAAPCERPWYASEASACCVAGAAEGAAGAGTWLGPDAALPDFDCRTGPPWEEVWGDLLAFRQSVMVLASTGSARATGYQGEGGEREIWANYVDLLFRLHASGPALSDDSLQAECPFGFFALSMARWGACALLEGRGGLEERCESLRVGVGRVLLDAPFGLCKFELALPAMVNSRWTTVALQIAEKLRFLVRGYDALLDPDGVIHDDYDCSHLSGATLNWDEYAEMLLAGRTQYGGSNTTTKFVFGSRFDKSLADECLLGFLMMLLEKLRMAQLMKTEEYDVFAHGVGAVLVRLEHSRIWRLAPRPRDSLTVLMLSRWPVFNLLCSIAYQAQAVREDQRTHGYQHKPYDLDFWPGEILTAPEDRGAISALRALPRADHARLLRTRRQGRVSGALRALLAALLVALGEESEEGAAPEAPRAKVVLVTMVWGARLSRYLAGALRRAGAHGLARRAVVFCLDGVSCGACQEVHPYPSCCVPGSLQTIYNKYTILSAVVGLGFDALYLDFDTALLADPLPPILAAAAQAEVLVSRDFGSTCLNTGVIFLKAHADTATLLNTLLVWLWHHPYEFSQKAFSAFLLVENVTSEPGGLPVQRDLRWAVLDPHNQFVTSTVYNPDVEGWTGDLGDIVVFHFLDGTGGVDITRAVAGEYINLYDLFYANPELDLADAGVPLWRQDPRVEAALLRSRRPSPPSSLHPCMLYPDQGD